MVTKRVSRGMRLTGSVTRAGSNQRDARSGGGNAALLGAGFALLAFENARRGPPLVGVWILHQAVRRATFVILGQVLRDGQTLRRDEEQAVAVLPFLHLVAGADPPAKLGLGLWIRIEVARAEGPPDLFDVARETFHHGLGHRHVRVQGRPGLL